MLTRILAFIMSILMTIFPFFGEKNTVSNEEVAEAIIYAVEKKMHLQWKPLCAKILKTIMMTLQEK